MSAEAHYNLGNDLKASGQREAALSCYLRALEAKPDFADAHCNLGVLLTDMGQFEAAAASCRRALEIDAEHADAHNNLAVVLQHQEQFDAAATHYSRAVILRADFYQAHFNLGNVLRELGLPDRAMESYIRARDIQPDYADVYNNIGTLLQEHMQLADAEIAYHHALAIRPDFELATYNLSTLLLTMGRYAEGWRYHEYRWKAGFMEAPPNFKEPLWLGDADLRGKAILIYAEQGFGDSLQFVRYADLLVKQGATVYFAGPWQIKSLVASCPGITAVFSHGDVLPMFDYQCPLLSLPLACKSDLSTLPAHIPYLAASQNKIAYWQKKLDDHADNKRMPRVGLAWAGDPRKHQRAASLVDRQRSIHFDLLLPLLALPDVIFYSLQLGDTARAQLKAHPRMTDFTAELRDFEDTAALIENLDLVITVDTSVAHLAGAIGKPVWLLNRYNTCWRWLTKREDSPWYPNVRIFRQVLPGDWQHVIANVRQSLANWAALQGMQGMPAISMQNGFSSDTLAALFRLAMAEHRSGRLPEAEAILHRILALDADYADAIHLLGVIAFQQERMDAAEALIRRALSIREDALFLGNLGRLLHVVNRLDEAEIAYRRVIELNPSLAEAYNNLGLLLKISDRFSEAEVAYRRALALQPHYALAYCNLANVLREHQSMAEAESAYLKALEIAPDHANTHYNYAFLLLQRGDFSRGWKAYEHRWNIREMARARDFGCPLWLGDADLNGKSILLHTEQGLGDTLQFIRYANVIAARGAMVYLIGPPSLKTLIENCAAVRAVFVPGEPLPHLDYHCPLMSLPLACATEVASIPADIPYLASSAASLAYWRDKVGVRKAFRVGLVWAGNPRKQMAPSYAKDRQRSIRFDQLRPLLDVPGVEFFSLQLGDEARAQLQGYSQVIDFTDGIHDFQDTASLITQLDLVISVDTSVVHLAGGLGKPVWLLNRYNTCWRWFSDREDSPWYSTMRIFRQPSMGDWGSVVACVKRALADQVTLQITVTMPAQ